MVSFDVTNLFPNIPPLECVSLVRNFLLTSDQLDLVQVDNLVSLALLIVEQNFFQFNNVFYSQTDGLAMGSSLSPLLAEIFMSNLEKSLSGFKFFSKILF